MSVSESDFEQANALHESSADKDSRPGPRKRLSTTPGTPRKRRRSQSQSQFSDSFRNSKSHLVGQYKDAYRTLFNEDVASAATRFDRTDPFYHNYSHPLEGQIGASNWSNEEKSVFYAALEKLGQSDVPGISRAVGTKSIPETRELLLLLGDALVKQGDSKLTLRDIHAAVEVSPECGERLELAGDALAWYQECFEAKQEKERFGDYWLITPDIAERVDNALKPSRRSSVKSQSTPVPEEEGESSSKNKDSTTAQILQDIPEGHLLHLSMLLTLSSTLFMNSSPDLPSHSPHWSTMISPLADNPSIYRTALIDFHTLVVSLTRRLTQACIMQASSRIRSRRPRKTKGAKPLVRKRDVFAAIDLLGMKRDGRERWRGAARRSGVRVLDDGSKSTRGKREVNWDEVEQILAVCKKSAKTSDTDGETGVESNAEEDFKARSVRSGTPLPPQSPKDHDSDIEYEKDESDSDDSVKLSSSISTRASRASPGFEIGTLEDFDRKASQLEEMRLWKVLGISAIPHSPKHQEEVEELELKDLNKIIVDNDNWRTWTGYRAEWEHLRTPVPAAKFRANQAMSVSSVPSAAERGETDYDTQAEPSPDADRQPSSRLRKRIRTNEANEIPIRGARAYAALQEERIPVLEDREAESPNSDDETKMPVPSIEDVDAEAYRARISDAKEQ